MSLINQVLNQLEKRGVQAAAEQTLVRSRTSFQSQLHRAFAGIRGGSGDRDRRMAMGADSQAYAELSRRAECRGSE